jgi:carboxypeptidase PM20D1
VAASGFKPVRTVIIVSGHDEEVRGVGARAAAALLKSRNIKAQFVLDEGMAVVADHPVTGKPAAIIGTAEKGYATMKVEAKAVGGHSSAPPADGGGVVNLSRAVAAISDHQAPMKFQGPGADMLKSIAPHASPVVKIFAANTWLFSPLLVKVTAKTPAGAAMLHTTIAPTMLKGSPKENVLPQDATAWINYRIAPGDTSATVMARPRTRSASCRSSSPGPRPRTSPRRSPRPVRTPGRPWRAWPPTRARPRSCRAWSPPAPTAATWPAWPPTSIASSRWC